MDDKEFESEFADDLDLSVIQVNLNTQWGKAVLYVPASYTDEEFSIYMDGVFKGLATAFEFLTGASAVVIPISQGEEELPQ